MIGIFTKRAPRLAPHLVALLVVTSVGAAGCDCGGDDDGDSPGTPTSSSSGAGGAGGGSGGGGPGEITESTVVVTTPSPFDAVPSNDGSVIYFTAHGDKGAGVYTVPAGGGEPNEIAVGDPFVVPFGIALSSDGKTLYIADLGVEGSADDDKDGGKIFSVSAEGGTPEEVLSTAETLPRSIAVIDEDGSDVIYFSGSDATGVPGLFKVPAGGGEPTAVAKGDPFRDPGGVAASAAVVYVVDTVGSVDGLASIIEVKDGEATEFLAHLPVGYPAGIALSRDGSALLVSGFEGARGSTAVLRVDIASKEITTFPKEDDDTYAEFEEPAGLHGARDADVYAFVDSHANGGTVFLLK